MIEATLLQSNQEDFVVRATSSSSHDYSARIVSPQMKQPNTTHHITIVLEKPARPEVRDHSTTSTTSTSTSSEITFDESSVTLSAHGVEEQLNEATGILEEKEVKAFTCLRSVLENSKSFRCAEKEIIRNSYESRLNKDANASFLLITGSSGTGKTSLARSCLHDMTTRAGGYFITGKFDNLKHPQPYKGLVSAFTEFTNLVIARGKNELESVQKAVSEAIGEEGGVLTSMIPALENIIGISLNYRSGAKADFALQRFVFLFRRFLQAVCSPEKPLVLLLDDIHCSDTCSLNLLMNIVKDYKNDGFVLVGTYDDKNPACAELMEKTCFNLEQCGGIAFTKVTVHNLPEDDVIGLVGEALRVGSKHEAESIGRIVYSHTLGNLASITAFLRWLQNSDLLLFHKESRQWVWDSREITESFDRVGGGLFLIAELQNLSPPTQEVLKVAACLGYHFDQQLIEHVLGHPVQESMREALQRGVICFDDHRGVYSFDHDSVHLACYGLIPGKDKEIFHVEIGRRLWRRLDKAELDRHIFILLAQIRLGKQLISREKERHGLASLCFHAGIKAAKASAFRIALTYLQLGVGFLDDRSWRTDYELCLSLYNAAAEMAMCSGKTEEMDVLIDKILFSARRCEDKTQAYSTRIYSMGMSGQQIEAVNIGLAVLRDLGETFPVHPCRGSLCRQVRRVNKLLRGKSDEDIRRLPEITDERKLACMNILQLIFLNALLAQPSLAPFVSLKLMLLTLEYGLSVYASVAFSVYGMTLIGATCDVNQAFRFGSLGLELLNRYKVTEYLPRVYAAFYGCVYAWKKPLRDTLEPLLLAHKVGLQTGDVEFSTLCSNLYCFASLGSGLPLDKLLQQWEHFQEISVHKRQIALLQMAAPTVKYIRQYTGLSDNALTTFTYCDVPETHSNQIIHNCGEMEMAYVFNEFEKADELAAASIKNSWAMPPTLEKTNLEFWVCMIALQRASVGVRYRRNIKMAKRCIKSFRKYSRNCPNNFSAKLFLLEAELATVSKKRDKALEKYSIAVSLAKESGFLNILALTNERVARYWIGAGKVSEAEPYYRRACAVYEEWGAQAKVTHLVKEMEKFFRSN